MLCLSDTVSFLFVFLIGFLDETLPGGGIIGLSVFIGDRTVYNSK